MHVVAHAAFGYAAGGCQVICDGIVGPWFIDVFRTAGQTHSIPLHYVVQQVSRILIGRVSAVLTTTGLH